jgi:hypothetical protein
LQAFKIGKGKRKGVVSKRGFSENEHKHNFKTLSNMYKGLDVISRLELQAA